LINQQISNASSRPIGRGADADADLANLSVQPKHMGPGHCGSLEWNCTSTRDSTLYTDTSNDQFSPAAKQVMHQPINQSIKRSIDRSLVA
jgi:hypothetical protein